MQTGTIGTNHLGLQGGQTEPKPGPNQVDDKDKLIAELRKQIIDQEQQYKLLVETQGKKFQEDLQRVSKRVEEFKGIGLIHENVGNLFKLIFDDKRIEEDSKKWKFQDKLSFYKLSEIYAKGSPLEKAMGMMGLKDGGTRLVLDDSLTFIESFTDPYIQGKLVCLELEGLKSESLKKLLSEESLKSLFPNSKLPENNTKFGLTKLVLKNCEPFSELQISAIHKLYPQISFLKLSSNINDPDFDDIGKWTNAFKSTLTGLDFSESAELTNDVMTTLSENVKDKLTYLSLQKCNRLGNLVLSGLLVHFSNLKTLDIIDCKSIHLENIDNFKIRFSKENNGKEIEVINNAVPRQETPRK